MPPLLDPSTGIALRMAGCLMFAASGTAKLARPPVFRDTLRDYRLLPGALVPLIAGTLPMLELALAGTIWLRTLDPWPELAGEALLLLFAGAMAINLRRGRAGIACGCAFGGGVHGLRWSLVGRNLALAALLPLGVLSAAPGGTVLITASGAAGGLALVLLLEAANAIWSLPPPATLRRS